MPDLNFSPVAPLFLSLSAVDLPLTCSSSTRGRLSVVGRFGSSARKGCHGERRSHEPRTGAGGRRDSGHLSRPPKWVPEDGQDEGLQQAVQAAGRSHWEDERVQALNQRI